ncbi:uncharacterized protein LOC143433151 [Xylocopa sonorina]|uniref:uncharacterized protein LOC143433151 n=1 Tax=Xylocopa sonorina TaxID=1818115 RepID=UPI00403AB5B0
MTEDVSVMLQKGLSGWWNEETEYIFQTLERWAAYARGYNRLRSERLSRGRMTMQGGQETRWSISANKLIIDDSSWSPRFHTLKKSRRKPPPEETKINCCGTFNYQSNSNLDSSCLETYRYDHSIYFKTIGDIKNGKKESNDSNCKSKEEDTVSISSEELVEWDVNAMSDFIANQLLEDGFDKDNVENVFDSEGNPLEDVNGLKSITWFNVDLSKLDLNEDEIAVTVIDEQNNKNSSAISECEKERNNNYIKSEESTDVNVRNEALQSCAMGDENEETQPERGIQRFVDIRRTRRGTRSVQQPAVADDNSLICPRVSFNHSNTVDPSNSVHR